MKPIEVVELKKIARWPSMILLLAIAGTGCGSKEGSTSTSSLSAASGCDLSSADSSAALSKRLNLAQTDVPQSQWDNQGSWGPVAKNLADDAPTGCSDQQTREWKRRRVIAVAQYYIGRLAYLHHHIPAWNPSEGRGLDCSNFTSWVYNVGYGRKLTTDVEGQATDAGRLLAPGEKLLPGDLIYVHGKKEDGELNVIRHVAIYVDSNTVIDASSLEAPNGGTGVQYRSNTASSRYTARFSYARRIIQ